MAVKKYKRSDKVQLTKNFRLDEFKCKCGKCDPILLDDNLVAWLQKIRDHFGRSVNVNSGYRCAKHNASPKVGGAAGSHHVKGMAADIRVEGITPAEVAKYAESIGIRRIGLYDDFVHIGSDTQKRFWLGHEGKEVYTFGGSTNTVFVELPVLKKGAKGDEVKSMQALINLHIKEKISTDGSFGGDTLDAVKEFQRKVNLDDDGSCGKATWSKLLGVN